MKRATWNVLGVAVLAIAGCDASQKPVENPAAMEPAPAAAAAEPAAVAPAAEPVPAAAAEAEMVREKATVGVGEKGNDLGEGLYSTPVRAYFRAQEQVAFNVQIPSNMNLYKATNGTAPKTHDEFMQKIIKDGMIRLPELPEGHRYVYDPEKEELMVEHP